jgi:hypothetical protein
MCWLALALGSALWPAGANVGHRLMVDSLNRADEIMIRDPWQGTAYRVMFPARLNLLHHFVLLSNLPSFISSGTLPKSRLLRVNRINPLDKAIAGDNLVLQPINSR